MAVKIEKKLNNYLTANFVLTVKISNKWEKKSWRIKTEYLSTVEHAFVVDHLCVLYLDEYLLELGKK